MFVKIWKRVSDYIYFSRLETELYHKLKLVRIWGSHSGGYEEYYLPGHNAV
jgi:hypothetical protein